MRVPRKALAAFAVAAPLLCVGLLQAHAQSGGDKQAAAGGGPVGIVPTAAEARQAVAQAEEYWTPQRMANAKPMDATQVVDEESLAAPSGSSAPPGPAGVGTGALPAKQGGAQAVESDRGEELQFGEPQHGTKPTDPLNGPYGPFQRHTLIGKFTAYPASTIGKLFFTLNGGNFVCSASVIGTDVNEIVTAGHCINDGTQTFATSATFCPSYNAGGVNPQRGCWAWTGGAWTTGPWHNNGDPDYDYAKLQLASTGSVHATNIANITGSLSWGWNWGNSHAEMSFGYPQASPFNGTLLTQVNSAIWYTHDFTAGAQVSKVMGNDMTGGSSGGPWILNWSHPSAERPDSDGSNATDPRPISVPFVVGVNSHKRCIVSCQSPPTATNGVFWQEMTSPPSEDTADGNDWRTIIELPI